MSTDRVRLSSWRGLLLLCLVVTACLAGGPARASGVATLTGLEDARRLAFPAAKDFVTADPRTVAEATRKLADDYDVTLVAAKFVVQRAIQAGVPRGWFVTDTVIGKFERIDYSVALSEDGTVIRVDVQAYREKHGQEASAPAWLAGMAGRNARSPLKLGVDVDGISGATLSCRHMAEGVRRVTRLVALLKAKTG